MKSNRNILVLILLTMAGTVFGQETGWEFDHLQGKVKTFAEYDYEFDISDSINHDEFMRQFYICGFDVDKMLRFADSIKTEKDSYYNTSCEYDSLGQFTKLHDSHYINEYDDYGHILNRRIVVENEPIDTIFFEYDEVGRLVKRKYQNRIHQWRYDLDSRLLEYIYKDTEMDSVLILEKYDYDKEGVLKKKESFDNRKEGNRSVYCEYDSKGNVIFERTENGSGDIVKAKTKYKYDKNDSIVKETCWETRWYKMPKYKDEVWQEIDSAGHLIDYSNYIVEYNEYKTKSKSVRTISRDEKGTPIEEIYEIKNNKKGSEPSIVKTRYDELGRMVEETRINSPYSGCLIKVFRYYEDRECLTYYATYNGDDEESAAFSHESLFFYDERGNCIAHIQWMPETQNSEYYFEVYRYEYYE